MSLQELGQVTISFGQAKLGQTFQEVLTEDPGYVKWFVGRYEKEKKYPEHVPFLTFIRRTVEELENQESKENKKQSEKSKFPGTFKSQPKSLAAPPIPLDDSSSEDESTKPHWQVIEENEQQAVRQEMEHQHLRLNNIEQTMGQVMDQLSQIAAAIRPAP